MADSFSIIGTTAVAINGIARAVQFVEGISGAPRAIKALEDELRAINQLLAQVQSFVYQIHSSDSTAQDSIIPHLQTALKNCNSIAIEVDTLLRPYVRPTPDPMRSTWRRMKWTINEKKVAGIVKDMLTCKQTLTMTISFAGFAVGSKSSSRVKVIERGVKQIQLNLGIDNASVVDSEWGGSVDTAYRRRMFTNNWIMQAESVLEEDDREDDFHDASDGDSFREPAAERLPNRQAELRPSITIPNEGPQPPALKARSPNGEEHLFIPPRKPVAPLRPEHPSLPSNYITSTSQVASDPSPGRRRLEMMPGDPLIGIVPGSYTGMSEEGQLVRKTIVNRQALEYLGLAYTEENQHVRLTHRIDGDAMQLLRNKSIQLGHHDARKWWPATPAKPAVVEQRKTQPQPAPARPVYVGPAARPAPARPVYVESAARPAPAPAMPAKSTGWFGSIFKSSPKPPIVAEQAPRPQQSLSTQSLRPALPIAQSFSRTSAKTPSGGQSKGPYKLRKTIISRAALQNMGVTYTTDAMYIYPRDELDSATVYSLRQLSSQLSRDTRSWWP